MGFIKLVKTTNGFNFKLIEKTRKPREDTIKRVTKLVKGICIKEGDDYKISVDASVLKGSPIDNTHQDLLYLDFTEDSYNIKGVACVFSKEPGKYGYTRYIRNESRCKFFPGDKEVYVPFCPNWICTGYVVKHKGKLMFEFNDCIAPYGYDVLTINEDD